MTDRTFLPRGAAVTLGRCLVLAVLIAIGGYGCGTAPRSFRGITNPAPFVRARSISLSQGLPESLVVPALIERLGDPDPVVRLSANEELKQGTGQDFGFVPWAEPADRARARARWQEWWKRRKDALAKSRQSE